MTTPERCLLRGFALSLLVLTFVSLAQAQGEVQRRRAPAARRTATFNVSGVFTGYVSGQVVIDGVGYRLLPTVSVYQLGTGIVPLSGIPIGSRVFASGTGSAGSGTVGSIIARPANEGAGNSRELSSSIRVSEGPAER